MYIWTKRQFVLGLLRLIDDESKDDESKDDESRDDDSKTVLTPAAAMISHTHNQCTWTPSHGQPLTPDGYRNLFETLEPHVFGESGLFADVVRGGPLDLSRVDSDTTLEAEQALAIIASTDPRVFTPHPLEPPPSRPLGEFHVNPLYTAEDAGDGRAMRFRLRFPSEDYEQEYGACRQYLPEEVTIARADLDALAGGSAPPGAADLLRRRVVVDLPLRYGV